MVITSILAVLSAFPMISSSQGPYNVECKDQQAACECNKTLDFCYFRLKVEELQTFTSYTVNREDRELVTRGTAGDTYFLNGTGFIPSLPSPRQNYSIREYGPCWVEHLESIEGFQDINCSIPLMVDGNSYRTYIAVNGQIPGPTLIVNQGQEVRVDV